MTGGDADSAESVFNHLLYGLRMSGFTGRVFDEKAAYIGGVMRYEGVGL